MSEFSSEKLTRRAGINSVSWNRHAVPLALLLSLGACATDGTPDIGDRLSDRGREIGSFGSAWSDGQKDVKKGERALDASNRSVTEGERDLMEARNDVERAEHKISDASAARKDAVERIADGQAQMTQAEADYAASRTGPSAVPKF